MTMPWRMSRKQKLKTLSLRCPILENLCRYLVKACVHARRVWLFLCFQDHQSSLFRSGTIRAKLKWPITLLLFIRSRLQLRLQSTASMPMLYYQHISFIHPTRDDVGIEQHRKSFVRRAQIQPKKSFNVLFILCRPVFQQQFPCFRSDNVRSLHYPYSSSSHGFPHACVSVIFIWSLMISRVFVNSFCIHQIVLLSFCSTFCFVFDLV